MKLFWCPQTRSQRALWMMEESGLAYEPVLINIRDRSAPRDPDFKLASPMGKVPALADGEAKFSESAAICMYVADRCPEAKLAPGVNDSLRGTYLYWMIFTPGVVEPAMSEKYSGREPNELQNGWGSFELMMNTFEAGMKDKQWILGDRFSAADVMVGSSACFLKQFGMLDGNKVLGDYADRCMARPAYQKAAEMNKTAP